MKTIILVLCLAALAALVSCEDFCCPTHTQIPDIRNVKMMQSVQGNNFDNCSLESFSYTHAVSLYELEDVDSIALCVTDVDTDCTQDGDFQYQNLMQANQTLYDTAKRAGSDRMVVVRAKNCAGYSVRKEAAIDFAAPKIVKFSHSAAVASCDSKAVVQFVLETENLIGDFEVCLASDNCKTPGYNQNAGVWTTSFEVDQGESFTATATVANCIDKDVKTLSNTAPSRQLPELGPQARITPACGGYGVSAVLTQGVVPSDTNVEACFGDECKTIDSGLSSVTFDKTLDFPTENSVSVKFNISNCAGESITTQTASASLDIKPAPEAVVITGCPNKEHSAVAYATVPDYAYLNSIEGEVDLCVDHGDGFECSTATFDNTKNQYYASVTSNLTETTALNAKWNVSTCVGDDMSTFNIQRSFISKPVVPADEDVSITHAAYCTNEANNNVTVSVSFRQWTNGNGDYSLEYQVGEVQDSAEVTFSAGMYRASFDVPEGSSVSIDIVAKNCRGESTYSATKQLTPLSAINFPNDNVKVVQTATEANECASEPQRGLYITVTQLPMGGIEYHYCVLNNTASVGDCDWKNLQNLPGNNNQLYANDKAAIPGDYRVVVRARYTACADFDYPHKDDATVSVGVKAVDVAISGVEVTDINACSQLKDDCVPSKVFTVENPFPDFLVSNIEATMANVRFCWDGQDCTPDTAMTYSGGSWTHVEQAGSSDVSNYNFKAAAFYCDTASASKVEQASIAAHTQADANNFNVSMTLDEAKCEAVLSFSKWTDFDDRVDSFRYCLGSKDEECANGWFETTSDTTTRVSLSKSAVQNVMATAYPARCSGYFMDEERMTASVNLPTQPSFSSDAKVEGTFTPDDNGACGDYNVKVSWTESSGADKYALCPHLGDGKCLVSGLEADTNSYEFPVNISPLAGQKLFLEVTALKNCAGGETHSITGEAVVPTPDCGSGSSSSAGTAAVSVAALVIAVLALIF